MKLFEDLNQEICEEFDGVYAPYYYRYLGYRKDLSAVPSLLRANGICGLFTETKPVILKSEIIAGNMKSLYCNEKEVLLNYAEKVVKSFGERTFVTNKDHYAPDYRHILTVGLPGLIEEIDDSLKRYENNKEKTVTLQAMKYTLGRLDQYLYPFYRQDMEAGTITEERVIEFLENVFIKLQKDTVNICIGGQNVRGECEINGLSRCILRAVGNCNVPGPNLSLRLTENTPDDFLDECIKVIGTGLGYPALMNDDVNIAALKKYGYEEQDICNYSMVGCIENFITGMQPPWSDGRFDTPRFFDYVFNNGISETNGSVGIDEGSVENIHSMQEFMEAFERQLAYGAAEYMAFFNNKNDSINQKYFPEPFLSCFCHDCIGRGLDINNGGSKYPSVHGVAIMGIGTVSDALAAIEKVVFIDKQATLTDIKNALNSNFEGYEPLRQKLLKAPKYGNDDPFADKYAVWFVEYLNSLFAKYKTRDGGGIYVAAAANISNIHAGRIINATPDGRKRGEPLSDAASPTYGRDVGGVTATLNSLSNPDYTKVACGSVVNQKFSPAMFTDEKRKILLALIRTYFKNGGQEIQINATSREVLEDAMEHPENYGNLVVRVSGFSAFYVTLDRAVQEDILNRTQQEG